MRRATESGERWSAGRAGLGHLGPGWLQQTEFITGPVRRLCQAPRGEGQRHGFGICSEDYRGLAAINV